MAKQNIEEKLLDASYGGNYFFSKKLEKLNGILFSDVLRDFGKVKSTYAQATFIAFLKNSESEQMQMAGRKLDLMLMTSAKDVYLRYTLHALREVNRAIRNHDFDIVKSNLSSSLLEFGNMDVFYLCRASYNSQVGDGCIPDIRFNEDQLNEIKKLYHKHT